MYQKFVLLGDSSVGKTKISGRIISGTFVSLDKPTIGAAFNSKEIEHNGEMYKIQLWDTAGEEKFRSMAPIYVQHAVLAFIVFDLTGIESFNHLPNWYKISQSCGEIPIVFLGNKSDLEPHIFTTEELNEKCADFGAPYFEVSALNGTGIDEAIAEALEIISTRAKQKVTEESICLSEVQVSQQKACC